jgi:IS5 family transposase
MRKESKTAKLSETEIERNKAISKFRYIVEQYFGISHQHDNGERGRFPKILKNTIDIMFRQFAFNLRVTFRLKKGAKILNVTPV